MGINRIGEVGYNNFGSKMIIIKYEGCNNIDVYFPKYNWVFKNANYSNFKKGKIKCPYEPRICGMGYLGEGTYEACENRKDTKYYRIWRNMIERCYNTQYHNNRPTYLECEVYEPWLNFQLSAEWIDKNYYEVPGEQMHLDKDILCKGNKLYSPETCIFVPERINTLFVKTNSKRGNCPIGVSYDKERNKFSAQCRDQFKNHIYLGRFNTSEEAFKSYKEYKENHIKQIADEYKSYIPQKLYDALYNYTVEITD